MCRLSGPAQQESNPSRRTQMSVELRIAVKNVPNRRRSIPAARGSIRAAPGTRRAPSPSRPRFRGRRRGRRGRRSVRPSRSRSLDTRHARSSRSSTAISRMPATSPSAARSSGRRFMTATTGWRRKPLTGMSIGVSEPRIRASALGKADFLVRLTQAACSIVSPGSTTPPGSEICPPCRPSVSARTVSTICGAMVDRKDQQQARRMANSAGSNPSGHCRRGCGARTACAGAPGRGPLRRSARRSTTSSKCTNVLRLGVRRRVMHDWTCNRQPGVEALPTPRSDCSLLPGPDKWGRSVKLENCATHKKRCNGASMSRHMLSFRMTR